MADETQFKRLSKGVMQYCCAGLLIDNVSMVSCICIEFLFLSVRPFRSVNIKPLFRKNEKEIIHIAISLLVRILFLNSSFKILCECIHACVYARRALLFFSNAPLCDNVITTFSNTLTCRSKIALRNAAPSFFCFSILSRSSFSLNRREYRGGESRKWSKIAQEYEGSRLSGFMWIT